MPFPISRNSRPRKPGHESRRIPQGQAPSSNRQTTWSLPNVAGNEGCNYGSLLRGLLLRELPRESLDCSTQSTEGSQRLQEGGFMIYIEMMAHVRRSALAVEETKSKTEREPMAFRLRRQFNEILSPLSLSLSLSLSL